MMTKLNVSKVVSRDLPEIRHYEGDLTSIRDEIVLIKESIPVFPKWVNEVNEVPDFSWIGKQFWCN